MRSLKLGVWIQWLVLFALVALPCVGGEVAVLKNGFSIRHERREVFGNVTRLYVNADGSSFVDVPTADIEHFEAAPDVPPSGSRLPASGQSMSESSARSKFGQASGNFVSAQSPQDLDQVVNEASSRYQLDPDLVNSVIKAESGFNSRAVSPKGAQGLMQLMPGTASDLGVPNAFDPRANVDGGARYLRELLERYNFDLVKALAAYNAGPARVEHFGGVPPFYETHAYVARIVKDFNKKKMAQRKSTSSKIANSHPRAAQTRSATAKANVSSRTERIAQATP